MSWVAEAKAVMMKRMSVKMNMLIGVWPEAMRAASGLGRVTVRRTIAAVIRACMAMIHQRLVLMMSTKGLQSGLMVQGR